MAGFDNPALRAFMSAFQDEIVLAQVLIRRRERGWDLRHIDDRDTDEKSLRNVPAADLQRLADFTVEGEFRPLKSAPSLQRGWHFKAASNDALDQALSTLYPGAIADWFALRRETAPADYREFTRRQTGMYRITTFLTDDQAVQVAKACCDPRFCLKQRLWSVGALAADPPDEKSSIPCFEPCAVLLEFARKAVRIEQEPKAVLALARGEVDVIIAALERTASMASTTREADFSDPANPRRVKLVLEKLRNRLPRQALQSDPDQEAG